MNITLRLLNNAQAIALLRFLKTAIDFQRHEGATIQIPIDSDVYDFTESDLNAALNELEREIDKFSVLA